MEVFARTPVDLDSIHVPQGIVHVILERCKGCKLCIELCPQDVLQVSDDLNDKGYHYPIIAEGKETSCVHCEFCTMICPEFAIFTLEKQE
jgi:2-oxoglutarate ferredoxin oxidoreductase subunit delta